MTRVITFGTFDLLHIGHLRILQRARALGSTLIVGVSSDELTYRKKGRYPVYPLADRLEIIAAIQGVDQVFVEESLEEKHNYIMAHAADILVMGSDWKGRFDHLSSICEVVYLPRTQGISTTDTMDRVVRLVG